MLSFITQVPANEFNSVNFNKYVGGEQSLVWHRDNEKLFKTPGAQVHDVRIISLSVGETRRFQLRRMFSKHVNTVHVSSGGILDMRGQVQDFYEHRIAPEEDESFSSGTRFNMTFRCIRTHLKPCPLRCNN